MDELLRFSEDDGMISYFYSTNKNMKQGRGEFLKIYESLFSMIDKLDYNVRIVTFSVLYRILIRSEVTNLLNLGK